MCVSSSTDAGSQSSLLQNSYDGELLHHAGRANEIVTCVCLCVYMYVRLAAQMLAASRHCCKTAMMRLSLACWPCMSECANRSIVCVWHRLLYAEVKCKGGSPACPGSYFSL